MIDLHCHMLPGIDDGAPDTATALAMARMAVADGIKHVACTPHIYPGLYDNTAAGIEIAVAEFRLALEKAAIDLELSYGADTHLTPHLLHALQTGTVPAINNSRYFLLEPPHHVAPPGLEQVVFGLLAGGYVPVITHPERLTWIADHFGLLQRLVEIGAWMQVTAGSLTGRFGPMAKYWAERFVAEGYTHILATDAHSLNNRPPLLAEGYVQASRWLGQEQAQHLVLTRPQGIVDNEAPENLPPLPDSADARPMSKRSGQKWLQRLWQRA